KRVVLYEPPMPSHSHEAVIIDEPMLDKLDALLEQNDREGILSTFYTQVVRMPASEIALARSLPGWEGRLGAAHTISREGRLFLASSTPPYKLVAELFASVLIKTLLLLGGDSPGFFKTSIEAAQAALAATSHIVVMPGQQHTAMNTAPELFL